METFPRMATTIRDVAQAADVGLGTVSRVLNNSPMVSDTTRLRVQQAIDELDYVPNPSARRLKLQKTLTVAVVVPFFTRPSFVERLRAIEYTLAASEYEMIIYNVETPERRDSLLRLLPRPERIDGLIIISLSPRDEEIEFLTNSQVPIVLVDAQHESRENFSAVRSDDVAGGRMATQHLINHGHKRIGYISDPLENPFNFTSSRDRFQGYRAALEAAEIPFSSTYQAQGEHGGHEARRMAADMLAGIERPTAIFAASDTQAMGVLEAARELELSVPQDVSVIGYDDIEIAEYLGLTTIRQQLFESGERAVDLLFDAFTDSSSATRSVVLSPELLVRDTTGEAPS